MLDKVAAEHTIQSRPPTPPPPAIPPFSFRLATGMVGVLLAVLLAGFNEHVTEIGLTDISGQMHLSHDDATWLTALFEAFNISAMAFAPWCGATFSIRRVTMTATATAGFLGLVAPFMPDLGSMLVLRCVQGLACGSLPPMLMTVALRYLPPNIKIYGLGAYALTSTFGPNMGLPLTGIMFEDFSWQFLFWEIVPLCALSIACVAWGLPQDPLRLERFRQFDWRGLVTGLPGICMIVIALEQGDRLDWFRSPLITHLFFGGGFLFILFMINEWTHPLPFFRASLLKNRNVSASLITLAGALMLAAVTLDIPSEYLTEVRNYRPIQMVPMGLLLAVPQLVVLPLVAALCNIRAVDSRHVLIAALAIQGFSYFLGTWIDADWVRENFYVILLLQVASQPMMVIADLVIVTMGLGPADGPFISGLFNVTKGLANAIAAGVVDALMRRREQYHSTMLLDHYGNQRFAMQGMGDPTAGELAPRIADPAHVDGTAIGLFHKVVAEQSMILACADIYVVMIGVCAALIVLNSFLPTRVYPPRAPIAAPSR
ncbi:multidrug resistance transporter [Neoasaia chiangmaiensis NBRC 101099]|uniref:EmrB/QacA family drug resistance transporter n=1 Tax=Neoasaia chiangmaiensis TaxID=320497 RepID=A0A1U9KQX0_9PROT|nr:MFS transporter [Neoasaia chiangmaiensis]AQS88119.1 EmrB/QacA family drug resistance transporter [Neoasaia chiangmaiensis]GBR40065.1 multidrug resistance transporter [Neoasaia chiangmaiensis NBRC 101099]GEN14868.1 MFS transporter [Neoasaia chiangmaiensis]